MNFSPSPTCFPTGPKRRRSWRAPSTRLGIQLLKAGMRYRDCGLHGRRGRPTRWEKNSLTGENFPALSVQVEGATRLLAPPVHDEVCGIAAEALRDVPARE